MRTNRANQDLRQLAIRRGLFLWQVARRVGVSEPTLCRWLREPLEEGDERRQRILAVLENTQGGA